MIIYIHIIIPYGVLDSLISGVSELFSQGITSSLQPQGIPLYPVATILSSGDTIQAPTWNHGGELVIIF